MTVMVASFEARSTKHCSFVTSAIIASIDCFIHLEEFVADWHCCFGLFERQSWPNIQRLLLLILPKDSVIERNQVLI